MTMITTTTSAAVKASYDIVPLPASVSMQKGEPFMLSSATRIVYTGSDEAMKRNAKFLADYLTQTTGIKLSTNAASGKAQKNAITLCTDSKMGEEAYRISVDKKGIVITGGSAKGMFYGIQTLRKSVPVGKTDNIELSPVRIADQPRFGYRGMMLDCSRHFFTVDFIKKYLDLMAMHNMNVFHWHLTDDQGWRIEIKKYPRLTSIGSKRSGTIVGFNSMVDDQREYGGFYTQDQAREIVEYARQRYITVIPEIDMPGHMKAALAAYPELGCTGGPYEVGHRWGIYLDVLCLGNEKIYAFCEDVLKELSDIFPAEFVHIGGDETPTERWAECPKCQAVAKEHGLTAKTLQGYFTNRMERFLNQNGKRIIGWDEILEGDINQSATIMSWRGTANGEKAAEKGHDVIMSPTTYCYFDFCQTDTSTLYEPSPRDGFISVEKVYGYEPLAEGMSEKAKSHILGVQANVWTEYLTCPQAVEYYSLPRMSALSEVQWSSAPKDFGAFKQRLTRMTSLFKLCGYTYAHHLWPEEMISPWEDN